MLRAFLLLFVLTMIPPAMAAGAGADKPGHFDNNLSLEPLTVSVFGDYRVRGLLAVELSLDLKSAEKANEVQKIMPRLRDRYMTALTRFAANRIDVNRPIDIEGMTGLLQDLTNEILGVGTARVLVGSAIVRRI